MAERRDYLLFDGACPKCSRLAADVEAAGDGRLLTGSLRDEEFSGHLDRARPGWRWEPTLLSVGDDGVRVFTGMRMRLRLARLVGARRALRIARLARSAGFPLVSGTDGLERRSLIKYGAASALGLAMVVVTGSRQPAHADPCGDCINTCRTTYANAQNYCSTRYASCRGRCGENDECQYDCWREYSACLADAEQTYNLCNGHCGSGPCA
jgi:hypothetical protein